LISLVSLFDSALDTQDEFVQLKATQILTVLLSAEPQTLGSHLLQPFISTLASFVQNDQANKRDVAVQCLEALLPRPECRKAVWEIAGIIVG
jgi:V-type H+-transporting ATPase subunit H